MSCFHDADDSGMCSHPLAARPGFHSHGLLAELSGQVYFDEDLSGATVAWSGALQDLTGDSLEAFEGRNLEALSSRLFVEDVPRWQEALRLATERPEPFSFECRLLHRDGSHKHVLIRGCVLPGTEGAPARRVGVVSDQTELWKSRQERLAMERELLHHLSEGTASDQMERLVHDLNNALMVAMGSLSMTHFRLGTETSAQPFLASLEASLQRMAGRLEVVPPPAKASLRAPDIRAVVVQP